MSVCLFLEVEFLFISSVEFRVASIVTLVHDFNVFVSQLAWITTEQFVNGWYFARLLLFADRSDDLDTLSMREFAIVVPPVNITTNPSLLTTVPCFQDVDLAITLRARQFSNLRLTCNGRVVRLHWAQSCVTFLFVNGVSKNFATFASIHRWCAFSVSGLGTATAGNRAGCPFGPC